MANCQAGAFLAFASAPLTKVLADASPRGKCRKIRQVVDFYANKSVIHVLVEGCAFRAVLLTYDLRLEDWPENTHGKTRKLR